MQGIELQNAYVSHHVFTSQEPTSIPILDFQDMLHLHENLFVCVNSVKSHNQNFSAVFGGCATRTCVHSALSGEKTSPQNEHWG